MDDCCRAPTTCRPTSRWASELLFSAQRRLNNYVDPLSWDDGTTATPSDQCTFAQLVVALLTIFYGAARRAVGLFAVTRVFAVAVQLSRFVRFHLTHVYYCPKPDRQHAIYTSVGQCAVILVTVCLFATVYVPIVRAAWSLWTTANVMSWFAVFL